jgi:hypothetical protein
MSIKICLVRIFLPLGEQSSVFLLGSRALFEEQHKQTHGSALYLFVGVGFVLLVELSFAFLAMCVDALVRNSDPKIPNAEQDRIVRLAFRTSPPESRTNWRHGSLWNNRGKNDSSTSRGWSCNGFDVIANLRNGIKTVSACERL